ncbi:nSTAND1 domain-containing NTPase [Tessaracoccus lacteus]|uniref:Restriction endonuclease n=1 Tax=Tessaracoccus lacteus TaxID=3041766 RepID=A0ABY8PXT1_9ACTN|nr:restriction endonuclease [Tessaracoccus sp. T21]WGT47279.1 restriction endonuclease [Tessaracoccus sp. T21]
MRTTVQDPAIILLSDADSQSARNNAYGHLFESFMAQVMHLYGYGSPRVSNLNVTAEGAEVDIELLHEMNQQTAIAECKAYSSPVNIDKLTSFYGELTIRRMTDPGTQGYFIATPRLTSNAQEKAGAICGNDPAFRVVTASDIWDLLISRRQIQPVDMSDTQTSDPAVVVHASGVYAAALQIDPDTKTGSRVLVRATSGSVHREALDLLAEHRYANSLPVVDVFEHATTKSAPAAAPPLIVEVAGSKSDFEYQLPASPRYFVGRRIAINELVDHVTQHPGPFVLNAKSGWGKSSLALKIVDSAAPGIGLVIDSRTAVSGGFIPAVLQRAFVKAQDSGILKLTPDATWATLAGSIKSMGDASWLDKGDARIVVVFDQFENTFRDEALTREFRDLALWNADGKDRVSIGFAWKTDFVDWTESHPFRLRDEIRNCSTVVHLQPFGSQEVDTILGRLEKSLEVKLSREIRQRLREYSQGLPWLLKKLAGHLIREISSGKTQEQLVAEALNVQNLFESDLAALSPAERDALLFVARFAPIEAQEVTERHSGALVQSLLDQRLVVQVGEKLDTYWDTFRDFVVNGRVPIEETYIIRQTPRSVGRLISEVLKRGGDAAVSEISRAWDTSENVVWNLGRELRQFGLAASVPNRIQLIPELRQADDVELELRGRIARVLKRHRAHTVFEDVCERGQGVAQIPEFAKALRAVFPAVEGTTNTWSTYARTFVAWFAYAGLARSINPNTATAAIESSQGTGTLLDGAARRKLRTIFPSSSPGPVIRWMTSELSDGKATPYPASPREREVAGQALALKAVHMGSDENLHAVEGLITDGKLDSVRLLELLRTVPGGQDSLAALEGDPAASPASIGELIAVANDAEWAAGTVLAAGKAFRAWARAAGIQTKRRGKPSRSEEAEALPLA